MRVRSSMSRMGCCPRSIRSTLKLPVWHRPGDFAIADTYAAALAKVARHHKDLL